MVEAPTPRKAKPTKAKYPGGAEFSPCGRYRYTLWRVWDDTLPWVAFCMLNPSAAGADEDDATVTKCCAFAKLWGYGGVIIVNPVAYVGTDPVDVAAAEASGIDVEGDDNRRHLSLVFAEVDDVVVAWGANEFIKKYILDVLDRIRTTNSVTCLGRTASGAPKHPCRLGYATPRQPFPLPHNPY